MYARLCGSGAVVHAISKERLTRFGLVSMLDYYIIDVEARLIMPNGDEYRFSGRLRTELPVS